MCRVDGGAHKVSERLLLLLFYLFLPLLGVCPLRKDKNESVKVLVDMMHFLPMFNSAIKA